MTSVLCSNSPARAKLYFTGVGSRKAPAAVLDQIRQLSIDLSSRGYTLRTGGADGCDIVFEIGSLSAGHPIELWLPWPKFKKREDGGHFPTSVHESIARTLHPIFDKLPNYAKYLHSRNVGQVLGTDCDTPSEFLVCWTGDGAETEGECTSKTGGTATAIKLAARNLIPVFNLARPDAIQRLNNHLDKHLAYPPLENQFYNDLDRPYLAPGIVFVFGSNLNGWHGAGAAKTAIQQYQACYGQHYGLQGRSFAIPTKDKHLNALPLVTISDYVKAFVQQTQLHKHYFYVTPVGCGLAGYRPEDIAPMFKGVEYCWLPISWAPYLK